MIGAIVVLMIPAIIWIGSGVVGFVTSSAAWRVFIGIAIVAFWGNTGNGFVWGIGFGCYVVGILLGSVARRTAAKEFLENSSPEEFVDAVDQGLASVIGTNNTWAQANWHSLDRQGKIDWITKRRPFLSDITRTISSAEIISVMQKADHQYSNQTPGQQSRNLRAILS